MNAPGPRERVYRAGSEVRSMDMNPYQAPRTDGIAMAATNPERLASRGARFGAALIDAVIVGIVNVPMLWALGVYDGVDFTTGRTEIDPGLQLLGSVLGIAVWLLLQIAFLRHGQTIGKRLVGLRMVDAQTGETAPLGRLVLLRYLPIQLVVLVPFVGSILSLVNVLFIFREDRRCIHDHIAKTKVVDA